jgi:hypothetical protein
LHNLFPHHLCDKENQTTKRKNKDTKDNQRIDGILCGKDRLEEGNDGRKESSAVKKRKNKVRGHLVIREMIKNGSNANNVTDSKDQIRNNTNRNVGKERKKKNLTKRKDHSKKKFANGMKGDE